MEGCGNGRQLFHFGDKQDQKLCFVNIYPVFTIFVSCLVLTKLFLSRICLKILDIVYCEK